MSQFDDRISLMTTTTEATAQAVTALTAPAHETDVIGAGTAHDQELAGIPRVTNGDIEVQA